MYVICSEVRFVEFPSPNECDKILKIPNEQTEPTGYMANCIKDDFQTYINLFFLVQKRLMIKAALMMMMMTTVIMIVIIALLLISILNIKLNKKLHIYSKIRNQTIFLFSLIKLEKYSFINARIFQCSPNSDTRNILVLIVPAVNESEPLLLGDYPLRPDQNNGEAIIAFVVLSHMEITTSYLKCEPMRYNLQAK